MRKVYAQSVVEVDSGEDKNWIQKALNPEHAGALHHSLKVPLGKKIPAKKLAKAAAKDTKLGRRARLAQTLATFNKD